MKGDGELDRMMDNGEVGNLFGKHGDCEGRKIEKRVIKALAGVCTFFCFFLEIEYGRYR